MLSFTSKQRRRHCQNNDDIETTSKQRRRHCLFTLLSETETETSLSESTKQIGKDIAFIHKYLSVYRSTKNKLERYDSIHVCLLFITILYDLQRCKLVDSTSRIINFYCLRMLNKTSYRKPNTQTQTITRTI